MIGDKHFGVLRIDKTFWESYTANAPNVLEEVRGEYIARRRVGCLSGEAGAFAEALMQMVAKDIEALGPDFDMDKYEIEMTATLQPRGTNKDIPVES